MGFRLTFFISAAVLMFSTSCTKVEHVRINIVQTTDVHGTIFPYDYIENEPLDYSLAQISYFVDSLRQANPDGVILLDNGDFLQGQPTVYYYNYEDTTGTNFSAQVYNYMKYDAVTVGNHDIECGHPVYDKIRKQMNMPLLAANAIDKETGNPYFEPYTVIKREGIKVVVLGLITPGIPNWLPEPIWKGIEFEDMVTSAQKWVTLINEKEKADFLIGMFHSGVDYTFGGVNYDDPKNENASLVVAEKVPGFDVILAGHDHCMFDTLVVNSAGDTVIVLDPLNAAKAMAVLNIDFNYHKETKSWTSKINAAVVKTNGIKTDEQFLTHFSKQADEVKTYVNQPIGSISNRMSIRDAYFGNSAFIDFIQKAQLDISGAQISFTSPLSFDKSLEKGAIYVRDLFKLYKYENLLYTMKLSGREIDGYLEYSYGMWFNQMKNRNDHLLQLKENAEGRTALKAQYYNLSSAAGIEYVVDVSKPVGTRVKILGFSNGSLFNPDSTYTVAINSYRGNGGGGHLTEGAGINRDELASRIIGISDLDFRYHLKQYIEKRQVIAPEAATNWRVIPEDYFEWGKRNDYQLLFPN